MLVVSLALIGLALASPAWIPPLRRWREVQGLREQGEQLFRPEALERLRAAPNTEELLSAMLASSHEETRRLGFRLLSARVGAWPVFEARVAEALTDPSPRVREAAYRAVAARYYLGDADLDAAWVEAHLEAVLFDPATRLSVAWFMKNVHDGTRLGPWDVHSFWGRDFSASAEPEKLWGAFEYEASGPSGWRPEHNLLNLLYRTRHNHECASYALLFVDAADPELAFGARYHVVAAMSAVGLVSRAEFREYSRKRLPEQERIVRPRLPDMIREFRARKWPLPPAGILQAVLDRTLPPWKSPP